MSGEEETAERVTRLVAEKALRVAARVEQRTARALGRADKADTRMLAAAERRAARSAEPTAETFYTPAGVLVGVTPEVVVDAGEVITVAPAESGVITPELVAVPGVSYVAAATVKGGDGWVGLQWVTTDGRPGAIVWAGGEGRVIARGTAPEGTIGARRLLVTHSATNPPGTGAAAAAILADLRDHVTSLL